MKHRALLPLAALVLLLAAACSIGGSGAGSGDHRAIGFGEVTDIRAHLVPGKITIVDFYSEFCPPCRQLSPLLDRLVAKRSDLALVKVDINRKSQQEGIDWGSPLARQYSLNSIPHLKIFGPDGQLQAEGVSAMSKVMEWMNQQGIE